MRRPGPVPAPRLAPVPAGGALRERDGVVHVFVALERDVRRREAGGVELREHLVVRVHVRRDERVVRRPGAELVHEAVRAGHALANPARRPHGDRRARAAAPLEDADAVRADGREQPPEERQPFGARQPLQHVIADDEVERARRGEKLVGALKDDVAEAAASGFAPRDVEHRRGSIDGDDGAGTPREREREPSGPAPEFERAHRRELRREPGVDHAEHPRDQRFTAREEAPFVFGREVGAEEARIGDGGEVRLAGGETLPGGDWKMDACYSTLTRYILRARCR